MNAKLMEPPCGTCTEPEGDTVPPAVDVASIECTWGTSGAGPSPTGSNVAAMEALAMMAPRV